MKNFSENRGRRLLSLLLMVCMVMSLVVVGTAQEVTEPLAEEYHDETCEICNQEEDTDFSDDICVMDPEPFDEGYQYDECALCAAGASATSNLPSGASANSNFYADCHMTEAPQTGSGLVGIGLFAASSPGMCFHTNGAGEDGRTGKATSLIVHYSKNTGETTYSGHSSYGMRANETFASAYGNFNAFPTAERPGYTFLGWFTSPQGGCTHAGSGNGPNYVTSYGTQYTEYTSVGNNHIVLYPKFRSRSTATGTKYSVCFQGNDGYIKTTNTGTVFNRIPSNSVWTHFGFDDLTLGTRLGSHADWAMGSNSDRGWPTAERDGYIFKGWYTSPEGYCVYPNPATGGVWTVSSFDNIEYTANSTMPANNLVLYARWEKIVPNYNVTYYANFPSGTTGSPGSAVRSTPENSVLAYTDVFGSTYPSAPGKSYSFRGWYTSASGGSQIVSISGAQTVYAQWNETIISYDTTFVANFPSGAGSSPGNQSRSLSSGSGMPAYGSIFGTSPSATGKTYTFRGWYTSASGGSQVTTVTTDRTVYAQWDEGIASYSTTFVANFPSGAGTSPGNASQNVQHGSSLPGYGSVFSTSPTASGRTYTFNGWFTSPSGGTQVTTATEGRTVYAQWTEGYTTRTITYHSNGGTGTVPGSHTGLSNVTVTLGSGAALGRPNHIFVGWLEADTAPSVIPADGTAPAGLMAAGSSYTSNKDVTLYAVWAVDDDGNGSGDYLQRKVVYKHGNMTGSDFTILLAENQASFITEEKHSTWWNAVDMFDGWQQENGIIVAANKGIYFAPDGGSGNTMTLTAVVSSGKTATDMTVSITNPAQQTYQDGAVLHGNGLTVTVTYRDGSTGVYDTLTKINTAGIALELENGKAPGTALGLADNGEAFIAKIAQPGVGTLTSNPSTGTITVGDTKHTVTLIVIGGDTVTTDILSVMDSGGTEIVKTNNRASGEGNDGETYTVWKSSSLPSKYELRSFYINGVDHTADFIDGNHSFVLTENTTIYAVYNHDANSSQQYNLYANVISSAGTGYIGARRANRTHETASYAGITTNNMMATKVVAESMDIDDSKIAIALLPNTGYRIGSVILNGDFITEDDARWTTASDGNVVILLEADGNIKSGVTYFLLVNYVKDLGTGTKYKINITGETYHGAVQVPSTGTGNKVNISGQLAVEGGYSNLEYVAGSTILFGATAGDGYRLKNITLDGTEVAIGDLLYSLALIDLDADHDIVATFVLAQDGLDIIGGPVVKLRGAYANESVATLTYYVRCDNEPLKTSDLNKLTFEIEGLSKFASTSDINDFAVFTKSGGKVSSSITGSEIIGGLTYAKVQVEVTVKRSCAVRVKCGLEGTYIEDGHYDLVMPGDADGSGRMTVADSTYIQRVSNGVISMPESGAAGGYAFELCDMNFDGRIMNADYTMVLRMVNGIVTPSN